MFGNFDLPTAAFGNKATVKVDVAPVPGEQNTSNNRPPTPSSSRSS